MNECSTCGRQLVADLRFPGTEPCLCSGVTGYEKRLLELLRECRDELRELNSRDRQRVS